MAANQALDLPPLARRRLRPKTYQPRMDANYRNLETCMFASIGVHSRFKNLTWLQQAFIFKDSNSCEGMEARDTRAIQHSERFSLAPSDGERAGERGETGVPPLGKTKFLSLTSPCPLPALSPPSEGAERESGFTHPA